MLHGMILYLHNKTINNSNNDINDAHLVLEQTVQSYI